MAKITPVILCGGNGARLWPVSRSDSPKQFQTLGGDNDKSFFQATVQRHQAPMFGKPWILVNASQEESARRQLRQIERDADLLIEPQGRGTAAAVAIAALRAASLDPQRLVLTLPSDHVMLPVINDLIAGAQDAAMHGNIVVIGIEPTYPETGFGYIEDGGPHPAFHNLRRVLKFVEKPTVAVAAQLIEGGRAYWAAGIALAQAGRLVDEFQTHAPDILDAARRALSEGYHDGDCCYLDPTSYALCRQTSYEYAVIERSERLALAPAQIGWHDIGSWMAIHDIGTKCENGNVTRGDAVLVDTVNSYVSASDRLVMVVGLDEIVVVDTPDALLVTSKSNSQKVKNGVQLLERLNRPEVHSYKPKDEPLDGLRTLSAGAGFRVEQIALGPGQTLDIKAAGDADFAVTVVSGRGRVVTPSASIELSSGQSVSLPLGDGATVMNTGDLRLGVVWVITRDEEN